jgi:NADH-quinone oxidoreductase subunit C
LSQINQHLSKLKSKFTEKIISPDVSKENRLKFYVDQENLIEVMTFISQELKFPSLEAVSGVDWETYFEVIYHIDRWDGDPTVIQIHVKLEDRDNPQVPSITSIWASANWHERELYDLFGIHVKNHPNLKRLLLPEEWDEYEHKHISELYPMRRAYQLPEKPYSFKPHPKQETE